MEAFSDNGDACSVFLHRLCNTSCPAVRTTVSCCQLPRLQHGVSAKVNQAYTAGELFSSGYNDPHGRTLQGSQLRSRLIVISD